MTRIFQWIVFLSLLGTTLSAQLAPLNNTSDPQAKALNNYVYFINESIHGMLIVHRLLENFNLDINKYVDLDSYQINFYSNRDLPKDIFEDPENWFYDISPNEWYEKIQQEKRVLEPSLLEKLNPDTKYLKETIVKINQLRFDIENLINTQDLTVTENLQQVYDLLEEAVILFNNFYGVQRRIEKQLYQTAINEPAYYNSLKPIYQDLKNVLVAIRNKDEKGFSVLYKKLATSVATAQNMKFPQTATSSKDVNFHMNNIISQAEKALTSSKAYLEKKAVPKEYEMYGASYYYYNSDIINKFNRYGSGIVFEMNSLLDLVESPALRFTELPHFYKVIYPRKLEKLNTIVTASKPVPEIPVVLEGRKLQKKTEGSLVVDDQKIKVEVFDHLIQDGDIVSLNFNGEWVLRRHKLTREPITLELTLSPEGKNFLVLHAENLGQRPPNTMAINYYSGGKRKQYIMNSDLNTSEVIEILRN